MNVQVRIPPALAAIHNFIMDHDLEDIKDFAEFLEETRQEVPLPEAHRELAEGMPGRDERRRASEYQDEVAQQMWDDYQVYIHEDE
jgi:hypothetical protein